MIPPIDEDLGLARYANPWALAQRGPVSVG